ncbi:MAG: tRNA (N6-isopentenyl adenosine(37)-C2)-methylthiotransferase MiaB [Oscillospiraceae bacterium]
MEREEILVSGAALARQKDFMTQLHTLLQREDHTPLAMVETFGCQQNEADGERICGMLAEMGFGFTDKADCADLVLLNTCAIREHAQQRIYGNLGALTHTKHANPRQIICLCGCMAQQEIVCKKVRTSYRHVDLVFGPHALWKFPELLYQVYTTRGRVFSTADEPGTIAEDLPVRRESGIRAWVSILYGCNNFCSYCIVPYVRGRERSRDAAAIESEVRQLVGEGYREITLLGQNVNSYGNDLDTGMDFADLLERLDKIPGDYLLRFISSHPKDASEKLFDTMARCPHVAKQLHLPVQSGNNRVLAAMNRRYTRERCLEQVRYARSVMPDLVLTSDIIIGFPGETEAEAMDTVSLIREVEYDALFTFIYSPRPGTPAAKLPDPATRAEKQVWFDRLLDAQTEISARRHQGYIGKTLRVLVDGLTDDPDYTLSSRTNGGRLAHLRGDARLIGQYADATITGSNTWALFGDIVEPQ